MALPPCGNRMPSHRIHTCCVCSPTDFHSSGGILPPPQQRVSHRIRRSHRCLCWEYSPTDFTDLHRWLGCVYSPTDFTEFTELLAAYILPQISQIYTELLAEYILPQISQNSQNFLLSIFSHRFHRSAQMVRVPSRGCTCLKCTNRAKSIFSHGIHRTHRTSCWEYSPTDFTDLHRWLGCLQGGALVSSAPTEQEVHQPSKIDILPRNPLNPQNFLLSVFSHRFHRFTQMVRVSSRGCTCLKCTNRARSTPT